MSESTAALVLEKLRSSGMHLAVAESLTGGLVASRLAAVSGASDVFLGGVVAYKDRVKQDLLGVSAVALETHSAISSQVALQMAHGVHKRFAEACQVPLASMVGAATTGVAGPTQLAGHQVGTVFVAVVLGERSLVSQFHFDGDRQQVREASCQAVFELILKNL